MFGLVSEMVKAVRGEIERGKRRGRKREKEIERECEGGENGGKRGEGVR